MAKARAIVKRRKTAQNIRKITRTMQLIATARFQAALTRATATKPYTDKLAELVEALSGEAEGEASHPLMKRRDDVRRAAILIVSSNRGLCGGYNASVLRTAIAQMQALERENLAVDVYLVGKKGVNYFRFLKRPVHEAILKLGDTPRFEQVLPIADGLMNRFLEGQIGSVFVVWMKFFSMARQRPAVMQLLPLSREEAEDGRRHPSPNVTFEYSPEPAKLLGELLPATVRVRLFQCFTDAVVCEQLARMVAMKAATDSAGEMIRTLTRQYNRARQTQITMELLDIVGGANALA